MVISNKKKRNLSSSKELVLDLQALPEGEGDRELEGERR